MFWKKKSLEQRVTHIENTVRKIFEILISEQLHRRVEPMSKHLQIIRRLIHHNKPYIDSKLAANITDVPDAMEQDSSVLADGFNELRFWLGEGEKCGLLPENFYTHIMRHVNAGHALCLQPAGGNV